MSAMTRTTLAAAAFVAAAATVLIAANLAAARARPGGLAYPEYAAWSGVVQVEAKLRRLHDFANEGDVDALILGSSMGDLGVSAETLTRELSSRTGHAYRVFNFSIGGADLPTFPILYRLARTVAKPRQVWLVAAVGGPRPEIMRGTLDEQLLEGPVARFDRVPGMLALSRAFYDLPLARVAPALRDRMLNGDFTGRPKTNMDLYELGHFGDTVSWLYNVPQYSLVAKMKADRRRQVLSFDATGDEARLGREAYYFGPRTVAALAELRDAVRDDGVALRIVAFDLAVPMEMRDPAYLAASRRYFADLAARLQAPVVDVREAFEAAPYMVSDVVHLNGIGSREFSSALAARIAGNEPAATTRYEAPESIRTRSVESDWTAFTALVPRKATDPARTLELHYLQNWGTQKLRAGTLVRLRVKLPDEGIVWVPARVLARGIVAADTSVLPIAGRNMALRIELVPRASEEMIGLPLGSFAWSDRAYASLAGGPRIEAEAATIDAQRSFKVRWSGFVEAEDGDWFGVYPVGGDASTRLTFRYIRGAESGEVEIEALRAAGRYEIRAYQADRDLAAVSAPFEVTRSAARS